MYSCLSELYLSPPSSQTDWQMISTDFEEIWNLPHVVGAIDGKHVRIQCPNKTESLYHNYKGFFSLVLLAICDARYCFTMYDVGHYGSNNDSGVLAKSKMGELLETNRMKLPEPKTLDGCNYDPLPYYLVGDEIFPLKTWLMRPYPGKLTEEQRISIIACPEQGVLLRIRLGYLWQDGEYSTRPLMLRSKTLKATSLLRWPYTIT